MLAPSTETRDRSEHRAMSTAMVTTAPRSVGDAMAARLRDTALLVVACGIAGALIGGIGSRVVGEVRVSGTLVPMFVAGVGSAILGAGAFTLLRPWLPSSTIARGLVFGGFLLAFLGAVHVDSATADLVPGGDRPLDLAVSAGLSLAFGLVVSSALAFLDARTPPAAALSPKGWTLSVLGALPVVPGILAVTLGFSPELGLTLLGTSVAMVGADRIERHGRPGPARLVRAGATAVLIAVTALAAAHRLDGVGTML
jgi:hypothetical protein